jgi:hypothetical protein
LLMSWLVVPIMSAPSRWRPAVKVRWSTWKPRPARGLAAQVFVVVGEDPVGVMLGLGGVEVGGDADAELVGVAGGLAGGAVDVDGPAAVRERAPVAA